jgi:hypothetical protein
MKCRGKNSKRARAEFKAKIRRYAARSIAFLGKRAVSAMIGQPILDWDRFPRKFAGTGTLRSMLSSQPTQNFG